MNPQQNLVRISTSFSGDPLDKTAGNWKVWSSKICDNLAICGLGAHIKEIKKGTRPIPDPKTHPVAYDNWTTNDGMACAYIRLNCAIIESKLLDDIESAYDCYKALEKYHLNEGPVKQVNLIQNALAQHIACDKDQLSNYRKIREDIRHAFRMPGGITEETFINITLLIVLSAGHEHIRAMIQRDMQAATTEAPFLSEQVMAYLDQDLQLLLGNEQCTGTADAIALAAQSTHKRGGMCSSPLCNNCKHPGHTADWCIRTGGGMAGKSIEEAQATCRKVAKDKSEKLRGSKDPKQKIFLSFKDANGHTFIAHIDADTVTATSSATTTEHANLATVDDTPSLDIPASLNTIETVECEGWLACLDEPIVSIDWAKFCNDIDNSSAMIAALHQTHRTPITSLDTCPFYLDSGASVHILPESSDFLSLRPITSKAIKGVGGSSIMVTGIGDIKLYIAQGTYITLVNVLFIPNSTVRLISISAITRDSTCDIHFSSNSCWIDNTTTRAIMARGMLVQSKGLYSLNLHAPYAKHALAASSPGPSIESWHCHLSHVNYQTIRDMARNRLVEGMPITFSTMPPDCDSCILGKQTKSPVPKKCEEGPGHRAMWKLEKVWVDLIGPISVSASGNRYVMDLLDDYTSKAWSILLKSKDHL